MINGYSEKFKTHSKFFAIQAQFQAYIEYKDKIIGCENTKAIFLNNKGNGISYLELKEIEESTEIGYKFLSNTKKVNKFIKESEMIFQNYIEVCQIWNKKDCDKKELILIITRIFKYLTKCLAIYNISSEEFNIKTEQSIKNELYLKAKGKDVEKLYSKLLTFKHSSLETFRERKNWIKILQDYKRYKKINSNLKNKLFRHSTKFGFLGSFSGNPSGWDFSYFENKLLQQNILDIRKSINKIKNSSAIENTNLKEKARLISKLKLSKLNMVFINNINKLSLHRMRTRETFTKGAFHSNGIFQYISQLIEKEFNSNIDKELLRQLSYNEIISFLNNEKKINISKLKKRYESFLLILKNNKLHLIDNKSKISQFLKNISNENINYYKILKGNVANSKGLVYGTAIVINSGDHSLKQQLVAKNMKTGEILITGMTHPNIILACEKASAIITDEGGVTCHAAIIARELGIPCIIGTKNATKLISSGDYLKVDSTKGIIEIMN